MLPKGLLTLETCWRKFKLQIPEISGFSYGFFRRTIVQQCDEMLVKVLGFIT